VEAVQTNSYLKSQKQKQNLPNQGGGVETVWVTSEHRAESSDLAVAASGSRKGSAGQQKQQQGQGSGSGVVLQYPNVLSDPNFASGGEIYAYEKQTNCFYSIN
jgi:hypothetical protein